MQNNLFFAFSLDRVDTPPHQARPNLRITFDELRAIITGATITPPPEFYELPDLARRKYRDGDQSAGDLLAKKKKALPYVLFSGFCPVHHNDATQQYNGKLQIDLDFRTADGYQRALDILQRIKTLRPAGVLLAILSPSTFGVKILLATDNLDKTRHRDALQAAIKYLAELLQIDPKHADGLGASQPCYVPFERTPGQAYFNPDADPLPIIFRDPGDDQVERPATVYSDDQVRAAAQYLIDNQIDVATCYDDYFRVCCACKNAFGDQDGKQFARDILDNSAAFTVSKYRSDFAGHWRSIKHRENGRIITGATLVHLARKNGFTATTARNKTVLQANAGEYLTAVLNRHQIDPDDVIGKYIVAPTGCGKTTLVAEIIRRNPDRRVVLVVPTKNLCDRIVERTNGDAVRFYGGRQNRQITGDERFIVTTVHSFVPLTTRINLQQYDVFFDEAHALTSDTSRPYKLDVLRSFYRAKNGARSFTYLTGTELYNFHPDFNQVDRLVIRAPQRIPKRCEFYSVDGSLLATVAEGVRRSVARGRFPVVLLNDKYLRLAELKTALADLRLAVLNSDEKENEIFQQITRKGEMPDDLQAIVTTTVLKEGNDVYGDRAFDVFVIGSHHSSAIEQLTARFRTAQEVVAYILKSTDRKKDDREFDPYQYAKAVERRAQRFCDEHNTQDQHDDTVAILREQELRLAIQERPVVIDQDGRASVCYFALNNDVFRQETAVEYANSDYQARNLRQYGFNVATERQISSDTAPTHDDHTVAAIKGARTECKAAKQKAHQDALDTLQAAINPLAMVQRADLDSNAPKAFKWFKRLVEQYNVSTQAAIDLLRETDTGKKYALLENRLRVHLLRTNDAYLDSGRILALQIRKIDRDLRPGRQYTADDLREKLIDVLRLDKSVDLAPWTVTAATTKTDHDTANRRAIALLRMFYDVKESGRKTSRVCPRKRTFSLNKLSQFHGHFFTTKHTKTATYTETAKIDRLERQITGALVDTCPF